MTLPEYCKTNNVDYEAVRIYIKRHGLNVARDNKNRIILPDETIEKLDEQYKQPQQVTVIEPSDAKLKDDLIAAQQKIITLQDQLHQSTLALSDQQQKVLLLDEKSKQLDQLQEQQNQLKVENEKLKAEIEKKDNEIQRNKAKGFFARLRGWD